MKNALILHGAENNSSGNWFPWLKRELQGKGYKVWVPDLPDSDKPKLKDWMGSVFSNEQSSSANKDWEFNEETVLVGHSAGATFILRILESLPKGVKIAKAILVAGFVELGELEFAYQYKADLVKSPFDWKKIKDSVEEFYFIASDNDHYQCGEDQAKVMQQNLGGKLIIMPGEDHFNLEKSPKYTEFPELLKYI